MGTDNRKAVLVAKDTHHRLKSFCAKKGWVLQAIANKILLEGVIRLEGGEKNGEDPGLEDDLSKSS